MSKQYLAIDMRDSSVIKKYNRDEFSQFMSQIIHAFAIKHGLDFFYYSDKQKAKYVDKFIKYWNTQFYSFGKQTGISIWRDSDDGYKKHIDGIYNKLDTKYMVFAKILKAHKDYYNVSFITPQWVLFNFNDVSYLFSRSSSTYGHHKFKYYISRTRHFGVRNAHHFGRYYAKLNDSKYSKSVGEPPARRMDGTLATRNTWEDWEDEVVSTKGNWKYSTKDKHQWEHRLKLKEPNSTYVEKEDPYTLDILAYDYQHPYYDQHKVDAYDLPWIYRNCNISIEPDAGSTLYAKEKNMIINKDE